MLQSEPELMMIAEYLRLMGATYVEGKKKIDSWKQQFIDITKKLKGMNKKSIEYRRLYANRTRVLREIEEYFDAEDFWFDDADNGVDEFFERYKLNLLDWDVEYFKRRVKAGNIQVKAAERSPRNANNTGTEQMEQQEVFPSYDRQRGMFGGCNRGGTSGIGSGNRAPIIRKAAALAGCVC